MQIRIEPAHYAAFTTLTKSQVVFPGILEAYDAVGKHLKEQGKSLGGPPREVYIANWDAIGEGELACDIAFPYMG
jgi:effector-binding domain-containing protein